MGKSHASTSGLNRNYSTCSVAQSAQGEILCPVSAKADRERSRAEDGQSGDRDIAGHLEAFRPLGEFAAQCKDAGDAG